MLGGRLRGAGGVEMACVNGSGKVGVALRPKSTCFPSSLHTRPVKSSWSFSRDLVAPPKIPYSPRPSTCVSSFCKLLS